MPSSIGTSSCITTNGPNCIMCPWPWGAYMENPTTQRNGKLCCVRHPQYIAFMPKVVMFNRWAHHDAPPNSLIDSSVNPKVKTTKG